MRTIKSNTTWVATEVSRMFKRSMQAGIPINSWTFEIELPNIFSKNLVIFIWILNDTPTVTIMLSPRFNLLWFCLILQVTNRRITTLKAIVTCFTCDSYLIKKKILKIISTYAKVIVFHVISLQNCCIVGGLFRILVCVSYETKKNKDRYFMIDIFLEDSKINVGYKILVRTRTTSQTSIRRHGWQLRYRYAF